MDRGFEDLANAIIELAVKDIRKGNAHARSAKQFLKSEWCGMLSNIDGRMILRRLEQELATKPKRNKKMEVLCNG